MTHVDFHVLPANGKVDTERWVCNLAAKAWRQGHRVYLQASNEEQARRLDDLLWTFRDTSFVPHARAEDANHEVRVHIGHGETAPDEHEVMVNLAHPVPGFFSRFERVLEVVPAMDEERMLARERYRFYHERGYPLTSHAIEGDVD